MEGITIEWLCPSCYASERHTEKLSLTELQTRYRRYLDDRMHHCGNAMYQRARAFGHLALLQFYPTEFGL